MSKRNSKKKGKQEITQEQLRALAEAMKNEKEKCKFPDTAAEAAEYLNRGGKMSGEEVAYFMTLLAAVGLATMATPPLSCCGIDMEYICVRSETNLIAKTCLES